jgi:recombinational DNA repair protein (RecF pathway)
MPPASRSTPTRTMLTRSSGVRCACRDPAARRCSVSGRTLIDLAREDFSDPRSLAEAKQLMRTLIGHYTGGKSLASRRIFRELHEL